MKLLFLDMDGVLTDFIRAAMRLHGVSIPIRDVRWRIEKQIGMSEEEFFGPMDFDHFANMSWTSEGPRLLKLVEKIVPREQILILTQPTLGRGSYDGKIEWVRRHIPEYEPRVLAGRPKWALSHADCALVDDSDHNTKEFSQGRGTPILVPRPWNMLRNLSDENGDFKLKLVLEQVKEWYVH